MKCYVYSHKDFDRLCQANGWNDELIPGEIAFISICCTDGSENHWFKQNHANVINMDFDDILRDEIETFKGISDTQAEELYKFIVANQGKDFFIHCSAGKSRSQAICKVITTMYEGYETRPDNPCLYPNIFVSNKLFRLLRENR